ncbi:MAG: hypothetical protein EA396_13395 [Anaerolineaceae bacterium]|nr:MAG: hypothetical protein EA396_13395 [Anaerolineaceae bacterium]
MIDLWNRLELIFAIPEEVFPEIEIIGLSEAATAQIAEYVVQNLRGVSTQFRTFSSEGQVPVLSAQQLVSGVSNGELIGAMGGELSISRFILPEMLFIFEEPGYMIIGYVTGLHWTPIRLIALFEFFRIVIQTNPQAKIELSKHFFGENWIRVFNQTLKSYLHEKE